LQRSYCARGDWLRAKRPRGGGTPNEDPTPLDAPSITLTGDTVSWSAVDHAASYDVTVGTLTPVNTTDTSYTVKVTEDGSYDITVVAKPEAGSTEYTVSAASNKVTYTYTAPAVDKVPALINQVSAPTKTVYYLDEKITTLDLTGAKFQVEYEDESTKDISITAANLGDYDLTTAGKKEITVSYKEGDHDAVTRKISVEVKERTLRDLIAAGTDYVTVENEFSAADGAKYLISDTEVDSAIDMQGKTVAVTKEGGKSYIDGALFAKSGTKLIKTGDKFVNVVAATYVRDADGFKAIAENLDGYYILANDIDLNGFYYEDNARKYGWGRGIDPIGKAPYTDMGEEAAPRFVFDAEAENGEAFTGTFDGKGYTVRNALMFFPESQAAWQGETYFKALFGYVAESGVVKNFTLSSSEIRGGNSSAFIAAVNLGTIENVVIDDDCALFSHYADRAGYIAVYNGGTIENTVCYATNFKRNDADIDGYAPEPPEGEELDPAVGKITASVYEIDGKTEANNYIKDDTDHAAALGSGWFYIEGYGTVYGNDAYYKIVDFDETWYVGQPAHIKAVVKSAEGLDALTFNTWGIAGYGANIAEGAEPNPAFTVQTDDETGVLDIAVNLAAALDSSALPAGTKFTVGINSVMKIVTIGAPYVTELTSVASQNITATKGDELALGTININATLSDGTTATVHPTAVVGFDKDTAGAQEVTLKYNELIISATITVTESTGAITASLKAGVDKVVIPYKNGEWSVENVTNWSEFFDISEASGYTVTASGGKLYGDSVTFTVSKDGFTSASVSAPCYLGVSDKASFVAVGNDLAGHYIVTNDIDFESADVAHYGTYSQAGDDPVYDDCTFSGIFDGNYKKLQNFSLRGNNSHWHYALFEKNTGTVKNVVIVSGRVASEYGGVAGLVKYNAGTVENCYINLDITGSNFIGGVVDENGIGGVVKGCVFYGTITATGAAKGGVVRSPISGWIGNNLFLTKEGSGATAALGAGEATDSNNATIAAASFAFTDGDTKYTDGTTSYTNNLSSEIVALIKEYL